MVRELKGHACGVTSVAWNHDSTRLATTSWDRMARIYAVDGTLVHELEGHTGAVVSVAWNRDSTRLATASYDYTVRTWTLTTL